MASGSDVIFVVLFLLHVNWARWKFEL